MAEEQKTIKLTEQQLINAFTGERQNLEALQAQLGSTENYLREILAATDALNAIKKAKEKEKIIVPLGAGIYIDASVESNTEAKSGLAGGVVANTRIEDALKGLEAKKADTEKAIGEMQKDLERIATNLNSISAMLRTMNQKRQEQAK